MGKPFTPNFNTPLEDHNKTEIAKRESDGMRGKLYEEFRDDKDDISWETEQLAKSYGIYLEFNRAKKGREKDWMYMIRLGIPGGGPVTPEQWQVIDDIAEKHGKDPEGRATLRLTTRQNVQFHWVPKSGLIDLVKTSAESGLLSLNGCGDNVRNVMSCPFDTRNPLFNGNVWAHRLGEYFQLPPDPFISIFALDPNLFSEERETFKYGRQLLNRKFKIGFGSLYRDPETGEVVRDNCTELRTNDVGIAPIWEDGAVRRFQIYVGGGQGEKYGKPSLSTLAEPLAVVTEEQLLETMDAIVHVHKDWGDRQNRHWARLKYVIRKMGVEWFRDKVAERLDFALEEPILDLDIGAIERHHGWYTQDDGKLAYGMFVENGRLVDHSPNGRLKTLVRTLVDTFQTPLSLTANQDLIFLDLDPKDKDAFEATLALHGYGLRNGQPYSTLRKCSGSCVGRDTCRLAYTDSEQFEPFLIDDLEERGWSELETSIGITGCERQCFRPGTKAIGLVGSGKDRYMLKLFGTEDGRNQGVPLTVEDSHYLRSIPKDRVVGLLDELFKLYEEEKEEGETLGYCFRRLGAASIAGYLKELPATADLMEKSATYHPFPEPPRQKG